MNNPINFIEPSEVYYLKPYEAKPWVKRSAFLLIALVLAIPVFRYMHLSSMIKQGDALQDQWEGMEEQVSSITKLKKDHQRLQKGTATLKGWHSSRINWPQVLMQLTEKISGDVENTQFTRLEFDETLTGLRHQIPGSQPANFHPLKRTVSLTLHGIVKSDQPEVMLIAFQRNMQRGGELYPSSYQTVTLETYTHLLNPQRQPTDFTRFKFTLNLTPIELLP